MSVGTHKRFRTDLAIFAALLLIFIAELVAQAQVVGATVSGTVTDPSGGVVASATVSATDTATAVTRDVTTDSAGVYTIPNLIPGPYDIRVSATGFSTTVQSGVTLSVGQQLQLNFSLKVGQTSTEVNVTGAAPQIELTSSANTGEVEAETVRQLPLNGRDWTSLAQLQPGVKPIQTQMAFATSARGNRGFGGEMTVSGQRSTFNNYRIDGISVNDYAMAAPGNVIGIVLGVDAIQEFQVLTSGFPAEYGRATGGVVNAISRSGTNQFHGSVYEFFRNSALDARPYFDRVNDNPNPPFKRNVFGASAGAPIFKNKLFIFGDYEGLRQTKGLTSNSTVFSDNARLGILSGCEGGSGTYPNCSLSGPCPVGSSQLSPNASICVNNYAAQLLPLWPSSSSTQANLNRATFIFSGVQQAPENFGTARVDFKIGANDSLFGTFVRDPADYTQPDAFNDVLTESSATRTTIAVEETHTFSSSIVNTARVGYNRNHVLNTFTPTAINPLAADTSVGGIAGQTAPRLSVGGGITDFFGGTESGSHYLHAWNSYQYGDDAFWTHGAHTIKFGGSIERMLYNEHTFQNPGGRYIFNNGATFGSRILQFLSGQPSHYEAGLLNIVDNPREFRQTTYALYVQDDWKFKSNLTFNIGLRYEPTSVLKDGQGRITNLATITSQSPTCGTQFTAPIPPQPGSTCGGVGPYYGNPTLHNFEPRLGFAWDPFKDGKSSIRGSFGLYDVDPFAGYFLLQQNQAAPFLIFKSVTGNANFPTCGPSNPACTTATAFASPFQAQEGGEQLVNSTASKLAMSTIEGEPHRNYVQQWTLSVQRQLASDLSLTVGYVGSHGVHLLMRGDDGNMSGAPGSPSGEPAVQTPYGYLFPCGPAGAEASCTPGTTQQPYTACGSATPISNAQVNPCLGVIRYIFWNTSSNYNGLNVNLEKVFARGFQFQVAYTFSKSQDDDSQTIAGDTFANGINSPVWWLPHAYYGPSDFNVTNNLTVNALYTIPTPKAWSGALKAVVADWQVGGIFSWNSGTPTTVTSTGDPLGLNNQGADPYGPLVRIPGCNAVNYTVGGPIVGFLNQQCFTMPTVPTSGVSSLPYGCADAAAKGSTDPITHQPTAIPLPPSGQTYCANLLPFNVGRNTIYGPNFSNFDFSIHKLFPITRISESFNIEFRAEIFNIFNHSQFVPPQPNSGDTNSALINTDGSYADVGNILTQANPQQPGREIQFALKVNW
jgi:Carboxypeptidase regulatory-like domain/TonB dependent receptor/TonB-dependent Receptor Plug Domain